MKQRQLKLYNGTIAALSTAATTEQQNLGINNKVQENEPFVMTSGAEITQIGTINIPASRFTIGNKNDGVAKGDLIEYATVPELQAVYDMANGAINGGIRTIASATTSATIAITDPLYIVWSSATNNLQLTSASDDANTPRLYIICNKSTRQGSNGSVGFITYAGTEGTGQAVRIPPGSTYMVVRNGGGQLNFYPMEEVRNISTRNTVGGGAIDGGISRRYFNTYSPTADNEIYGLSIVNPCAYLPYSLIVRNTHGTYNMTLTFPSYANHFSKSRTYKLAPSKVCEVSVVYDPGLNVYYWQVSEELSNA